MFINFFPLYTTNSIIKITWFKTSPDLFLMFWYVLWLDLKLLRVIPFYIGLLKLIIFLHLNYVEVTPYDTSPRPPPPAFVASLALVAANGSIYCPINH